MSASRPILWTPSKQRAEASRMAEYIGFLADTRDLTFKDYNALWAWSVRDLEAFWQSIWDFFQIRSFAVHERVLARREMPGAEWFPGAQVNYADHILSRATLRPDAPAIVSVSETFGRRELSWRDLHAQVASVASHLHDMGVGQGDRVVAVLPNTEAAIIACLATTSLGAIWSICAPDMGHIAVLDRFRQIEPKVLIAQDGYVHAGKMIDRRSVLADIRAGLPSLTHALWLPVFKERPVGAITWSDLLDRDVPFAPVPVTFDHPLWVVYSSGTTGNPKPIIHGHGGIMLEGSKQALHQDLSSTDRYCWLTSSGWIMWNAQHVALAQGATVAMFDGAPNHPDTGVVWRFVAQERLSYFGAGAAFFSACRKSDVRPIDLDLSALRSLGSTGSPLTADAYDWIYGQVKPDVWLAPISGGTDLSGAFVGGNPMLPVRAGEMQCRFLGNAVRAFDAAGSDVIGQVGELVCTEPLPSMPIGFWGDTDGRRLHESYFDIYPGVWCHGDWIEITPDGGSVIYGRSDATINRKGLRLGSSEIYQAVEALPEVLDSLVIDLEFLGRASFLVLFVVLGKGSVLDDALTAKINDAIRQAISAKFLPNDTVAVDAIPRTLSGKKLEVPVKKLLLGHDAATVVNRDSMANPESFDTFVAYAAARKEPE
ncbi:MAG: acetoacetate--CoA ligase [Pseudomonadota bacterium]